MKTYKLKTRNIVKLLLIILFLLLGYIAWQYYHPDKTNISSLDIATQEKDEIIRKVGAHIVFPTDETPTLATDSDPEQLKRYPFFTNAEKGDKVLIYSIAKKAILYRPDGDKIVEIAPIITKSNTSESPPAQITSQKNSTSTQIKSSSTLKALN